nr:hypothetical protein [Caulobacter sp. B11]
MQLSLALSSSPLAAVRDRLLTTFGPSGRPSGSIPFPSWSRRRSAPHPGRPVLVGLPTPADRFPSWEDLAEAPEPAVLEAIHDVAFAADKARQLPHALRLIQIRCKWRLTLDHLKDLEIDSARWWLQGLLAWGSRRPPAS